jgi:hypothetical protein
LNNEDLPELGFPANAILMSLSEAIN